MLKDIVLAIVENSEKELSAEQVNSKVDGRHSIGSVQQALSKLTKEGKLKVRYDRPGKLMRIAYWRLNDLKETSPTN
jgi:hypothetical protein